MVLPHQTGMKRAALWCAALGGSLGVMALCHDQDFEAFER